MESPNVPSGLALEDFPACRCVHELVVRGEANLILNLPLDRNYA
jgi:hypothetical protein